MPRYAQKLVKNGKSTQVTICRPALYQLGWLPGEMVAVSVLPGKLVIEKLTDAIGSMQLNRVGQIPELKPLESK